MQAYDERTQAALARWHSSTSSSESRVQSGRARGEPAALFPVNEEMRHWRRGESASIHGTYRQASVDEMLDIIEKIEQKQIKWTEVDKLYAEGKSRVSGGTLRTYFYGKGAAEKRAMLKEKHEFAQLGAPRQVSILRGAPWLKRVCLRASPCSLPSGSH